MQFIKQLYKKNKFMVILVAIGFILVAFIIPLIIVGETYGPTKKQSIFQQVGEHPRIIKKIGKVCSDAHRTFVVQKSIEYGETEYNKAIVYGMKKKYAKIEFWINKSDSIWVLDSVNILETADTYRELKE